MVAAEAMSQPHREGEEETEKVKKKNCRRAEEEKSRCAKSVCKPDDRRNVQKVTTADWGTVTKQTEQILKY